MSDGYKVNLWVNEDEAQNRMENDANFHADSVNQARARISHEKALEALEAAKDLDDLKKWNEAILDDLLTVDVLLDVAREDGRY